MVGGGEGAGRSEPQQTEVSCRFMEIFLVVTRKSVARGRYIHNSCLILCALLLQSIVTATEHNLGKASLGHLTAGFGDGGML